MKLNIGELRAQVEILGLLAFRIFYMHYNEAIHLVYGGIVMNTITRLAKFTGHCVENAARGFAAGTCFSAPIVCLVGGMLYGGTLKLYKKDDESDKTDKN